MNISRTALSLGVLSLAACFSGRNIERLGPDVYGTFSELKAAAIEGLDYSREVYDRGSEITVFAIHGGKLERGTTEVARALAGRDFNLYIFNALGDKAGRLHITAAKYDEPEALRLAGASVLGVSIHASRDYGSVVCVGGEHLAVEEERTPNPLGYGHEEGRCDDEERQPEI